MTIDLKMPVEEGFPRTGIFPFSLQTHPRHFWLLKLSNTPERGAYCPFNPPGVAVGVIVGVVVGVVVGSGFWASDSVPWLIVST
jgi:hypothetical protein